MKSSENNRWTKGNCPELGSPEPYKLKCYKLSTTLKVGEMDYTTYSMCDVISKAVM